MDNLILVGCGNRGLHHLDAMQKFGTVPRMFCDFNETSLSQLKNKHKNSMFFNDLNDLTKKIENNLSHFAIVSVDVVSKILPEMLNTFVLPFQSRSILNSSKLMVSFTVIELLIIE